ncbi:transporter substrate-binding domain-containing protein [Variovorax sp. EL159]|uniref:transporter substrate-binding domain-containing protein n=1 Tax=Variovorax sp. EL159 TaxID=1566270 RepID=UPI000887D8D3|nr:transporter substrate-binding domain-containing protein [Variovorax sp. EL159]SCX56716.1 amino acid ABC transporter substrate-binding protein, PAAT family (TC 3.A.1.3.-) [Variovorax sp. EL159]
MTTRPLLLGAVLALAFASAGAQDNGTLAKARAAGTITMGVREASPPLSYSLGTTYVGYHVELCEQTLSKLLPGVAIRQMAVTSQNRLPLLQNGTIDIECGSTTNNAARQQQAAFANTTYITEARFAVRAASGITSVEQLKGKTVVTTTGTTLVQRLRKLEQDRSFGITVVLAKDHAESFLLLESGRADAFAMDDNTLAGNIANARNPADFRIVGKPLGIEPIAIMLRKDDRAFKSAVDGYLAGAAASGALEKLYAKWFMAPIPPKNAVINIPLSDSLKAAFLSPNDRPAEAYEDR